MSVHLHFGILAVDPDGPARLLLDGVEVAAGEDRDEIMLTGRTFPPTAEAGFVDVGSWQVWAEPNDDEDPHQSLHVVVALPESPNAATVTQVRWALLDLVDQHCRVADVAVITAKPPIGPGCMPTRSSTDRTPVTATWSPTRRTSAIWRTCA